MFSQYKKIFKYTLITFLISLCYSLLIGIAIFLDRDNGYGIIPYTCIIPCIAILVFIILSIVKLNNINSMGKNKRITLGILLVLLFPIAFIFMLCLKQWFTSSEYVDDSKSLKLMIRKHIKICSISLLISLILLIIVIPLEVLVPANLEWLIVIFNLLADVTMLFVLITIFYYLLACFESLFLNREDHNFALLSKIPFINVSIIFKK